MSFYGIKPKGWPGKRSKARDEEPNPYDPKSPTFAERNRQTTHKMPNGLTRVDIGEPLP